MAQLAGKYVIEKEENLNAYLTGLGLTDEQLQGALNSSKELEIKVSGSEYTISSGLGTRTFPLDKEVDETLADGSVLKSTATLSGNKLSIKSVGSTTGKKGERLYEASENGLALSLSNEVAGSAKVYFKRA